jgi:hypothetical protein
VSFNVGRADVLGVRIAAHRFHFATDACCRGIKYLAKTVPFDLEISKERYQNELRWQLGKPEREDLTLRFWVEAMQEETSP